MTRNVQCPHYRRCLNNVVKKGLPEFDWRFGRDRFHGILAFALGRFQAQPV